MTAMRNLLLACLASATLLTLTPTAPAQAPLVLSEFMALNSTNLVDEDGQFSDWIEVYNPTTNTVDLLNWCLTDSAANLAKWRFPATNLAPYSYVVVFASGKDRAIPGAPLHANFALSGSGEYLALVAPDGTNIVMEYAPRFPAQLPNVSYGLGMVPGLLNTLVSNGAPARVLVPASDLGSAWTGAGFDDSSWLNGNTGVGFDLGTNYGSAIGLDLTSQMLSNNASAYVRIPFNVTDPAEFQDMKLRMAYDDGFIAYINGVEVARAKAPSSAAWNSTATGAHGSDSGAAGRLVADFDTVTNTYTSSHFEASGVTNPRSPTIEPANAGSTGRFLRLVYDGSLYNNNAVAFDRTVAGRFPVIEADFDFRMTDSANNPADGFAFMIIPTSVYGTSGRGANTAYAGVEEPNYAGVFALGFDMYQHPGVNDVSAHWNGAEFVNFTIPTSTIEMVSGQFHRCQARIEYVDGGGYVTVVITPNVNSTPGTPLTAINRWFIPGLTNYDCRVEFAGRTGGLDMAVDLDNINVEFRNVTGVVPPEDFDISRFASALRPGANVLAIQGLNLTANDGDFFIQPELLARSVTLQRDSRLSFAVATPGGLNSTGDAQVAAPPTFSIPSGVYASNLLVELSSTVPGAVIHYTLTGAQPDQTSPAYTGPIAITNSAMITARTYAPGHLVSPPVSQGYTLLDPSIVSFSSGLPIIIIDTFGKSINQNMDPRVTCNFTVIDVQPGSGRATLFSRPNYQGRAGLEGRGQTSWGFAKKPYNVELRDAYDQDQDAALLGMPADSDWILFNPYNEKTFMNDFLSYEWFEQMGHYSVRRRFVEVFLNGTRPDLTADPSQKVGNSGDYVGIFVLLERIKIGADRVDIQGPQTGDAGDPITGGYIWKKDKGSPGDVVFTTPSQTSTDPASESLKYHDPKPQDMTPVQRAWLTNYLYQFEAVLYGQNWRDPVNGYAAWIDMGSWVDHHWIVEFTKQIDGYRLSDYMHLPRGGKLAFGPIWDWNLSIGNANYLDGGNTNGWYYTQISAMQHMYLRRLVGDGSASSGDPDFQQKLIDRWGELRVGLFHPSNLLARVDQLTNYLNEAKDRDFARWPRISTYIWPNPDGQNTTTADSVTLNWHVNYATIGSYGLLIGEMKKWLTGRYAWIDSLYLKAPAFSRYSGSPGAPLTMLAPTGTVYYTTDGSDPRLAGGLISPNARAYSGPVVLPADSRVFARVWHTNAWSPPTRAIFGDPVPALAVTEIMYHPEAPEGSPFDAEEFEFLELANNGANALDLTGFQFVNGVGFTFPPGALQPVGAATTNAFEGTGTAYASSTLGSGSGAAVQPGGPSGGFLRMTTSGTGTNRNRIAFNQTASGSYDVVTAEFDFRGINNTPPPVADVPTVQNFDSAGTTYGLRNFDTAGDPTTPRIMTDGSGPTGNYVRLTRQLNDENGGIYFDATESAANSYVVVNFDFRAQGGADGFGFVFLNTASYGVSGTNTVPSWSEEPNIAGSIGVGFDIYNNGPTATEPNANHVSLHYGSLVANAVNSPALTLAAGVFHRAQVTIKFETTPSVRALVTLKVSPDVYGAGGSTETLFNDFPIAGAAAYRGRLAFCARTGGANANHDLDNISAQYYSTAPTASGGLSMLLLPVSTFGSTGPGTGTNHFLDVPAVSNVFAVNLDMNISASVNDANLYWNGAQRGNAVLPTAALDLDGGVFHRAWLELRRTSEGSLATMTLSPNVYGAGGQTLTVFSNLLISGLSPADARVELAGRTGSQSLSVDVDNVRVRFEKHDPNLLAPGQRTLLVRNRAAFESLYGTGLPIAGEYSGLLDNAGERLVLVGRYGELLLDFTYGDAWYPITDGNGFSLVLANPNAPLSQWSTPGVWSAGSQAGGSPGVADPAPPALPLVVINEVLAHSDTNLAPGVMDAIELHNLSASPADVSGWYLSDDFGTPKKYRIPASTVIPAGGFAVFYETNYNDPALGAGGFGLKAEGDDIYLFSANAGGALTGYYHGFDFGASEANTTLGRHVDSTGNDQFVAQVSPSLGATNAGPKVGPIVITEVMYHPPDEPGGVDNSWAEYVELRNITGDTVLLADPAHPTNTWRLRDAVTFQFPPGASLPAGGRLLAVGFDPAVDLITTANFLSRYGLPAQTVLYGPWSGKLDNSSDRVELVKPGEADPDTGNAPSILVDKVKYSDDPPWPAAPDGAGFALHRLNDHQFGNDPANWVAGPPTPASGFAPGAAPSITTQPASQNLLAWESATLMVAASGQGPFTYQWRFNGNNLAGETSASLSLVNAQVGQSGAYQVVVMNASGSVDSAVANVTVNQAATILAQPANQAVPINSNATFTVTAIGNGSLTYQWLSNGVALAGATNATYTINSAQLYHAALYSVALTDAIGTITSQPASLIVLVRAVITEHPSPASQVVALGETATITAEASGTEPFYCRWRTNNSTHSISIGPSPIVLTLTNQTLASAAFYDVIVTNLATMIQVVSRRAYVTVVEGPTNQAVQPGASVTLRAVVGMPPSFTNRYWWVHNGTNVLAQETNINTLSTTPRRFTNDLVLNNITEDSLGLYSLLVSNTLRVTNLVSTNLVTFGAAFDARIAFAAADTDGDGMPDEWEIANGFNPNDPGDALLDQDGDGMLNGAEFTAGTDPRDSQSYLKIMVDGVSDSEAVLQFNALANKSYSVLSRETLTNAAWNKVADVEAASTDRVARVTNSVSGAATRFYRLTTPKTP